MKIKLYNETLNVILSNTIPSDDCASCTLYVVLFAVFLTTNVIIGGVFAYFYWYSKKKIVSVELDLILANRQQFIRFNFVDCNKSF